MSQDEKDLILARIMRQLRDAESDVTSLKIKLDEMLERNRAGYTALRTLVPAMSTGRPIAIQDLGKPTEWSEVQAEVERMPSPSEMLTVAQELVQAQAVSSDLRAKFESIKP